MPWNLLKYSECVGIFIEIASCVRKLVNEGEIGKADGIRRIFYQKRQEAVSWNIVGNLHIKSEWMASNVSVARLSESTMKVITFLKFCLKKLF